MNKPTIDYHMHTPLCGHAYGSPTEYAQRAVDVGLDEIGFSDHAPFVHMVDPKVTMSRKQLPEYCQMIEEVQDRFKDKLKIKIALEADYIPGFETKTQEVINEYEFDYIIGSVHFIKDWGFDNPDERAQWDQRDVNKIYRDYFELLRKSALSGMFDIMGHVDLVKKFGHRPTADMTKEIYETAEVFKETGMAIEINSSGLRKPCKELYPALDHLKIYAKVGCLLTFGSDAHRPADVGKDFDQSMQAAQAAGFKEYITFSQRNIENSIAI